MNRSQRRWKTGKHGRKALAALLAASLLAMSPLSGMEAQAASTDDLVIYGGGGGGGTSLGAGGGGGGYVNYGGAVQFGGGGNGVTYDWDENGRGGSITGGGVSNLSFAPGSDGGLITGANSSNNNMGQGDSGKVANATDDKGVPAVSDTIIDFDVQVTKGGTPTLGGIRINQGRGGNAEVTLENSLALHNLTVYSGSYNNFGGDGGNGGDASFKASAQTVTLSGDLIAGAGTGYLAGSTVVSIDTLVATDSGTYTFNTPSSSNLNVAINKLELQADVSMKFTDDASFNTHIGPSLTNYNFNGGTLTIEDNANLDGGTLTLLKNEGDQSKTLIQVSAGKRLSGAVSLTTSIDGFVEWQVTHSEGTASFPNASTSVALDDFDEVTSIKVVTKTSSVTPNPPADNGGTEAGGNSGSGSGLAATSDLATSQVLSLYALVIGSGIILGLYADKRKRSTKAD